MADTKIQWHPGFVAAMDLEFKENRDDLIFEKEYNLNTKPLEADLLIIKKNPRTKLENEIGEFFRGHNLLEYKSPRDSLNINTFYKVQGYACLYKAAGAAGGRIDENDITTAIVREGKPEGLFQSLEEKGIPITPAHKGIYHITEGCLFPMQVLVTKELDMEAHIWLKSLSENLQKEDVEKLLKCVNGLEREYDREMADSVLRVSVDANEQLIRELMEDGSMYESLMELMEPQIQILTRKSWDEGLEQGRIQGQKQGQQEGIKGAVIALRGFGHGDSEIKAAIIKTYGLSEETAEEYL